MAKQNVICENCGCGEGHRICSHAAVHELVGGGSAAANRMLGLRYVPSGSWGATCQWLIQTQATCSMISWTAIVELQRVIVPELQLNVSDVQPCVRLGMFQRCATALALANQREEAHPSKRLAHERRTLSP